MSEKNFLYMAGKHISPFTAKKTYQLLLPETHITVPPGELYNSVIWVVATVDGANRLYAKLYPISVESISDEVGDNRTIINADISRSTYFLSFSPQVSTDKYIIDDTIIKCDAGQLISMDKSSIDYLLTLEDDARSFKFTQQKAPNSFIQKIEQSDTLTDAISCAVSHAKEQFSVSDLSCNAKERELDEYHAFAYNAILTTNRFSPDEVKQAIYGSQGSVNNIVNDFNIPGAADLHEINPSKISARTFIAPADNSPHSMLATEKAEARHQQILKDVAEYLCSQGFKPYESSSVDLAIRKDNGIIIFEIKSANAENFGRQAEKALGQLLRYEYEFHVSGEAVIGKYLIIDKCADSIKNGHLLNWFEHNHLGVLFYDSNFDWPDRLKGIDKI